MKKTLTPNITRYDNKMTLRMNRHTLKALLISVLAGLLLRLILGIWLSVLYALPFAIMGALLLLLAQLAEKDGTPVMRLLLCEVATPLLPPVRRQYEHTADQPFDRLIIDRSIIQKKQERRNHEKQNRSTEGSEDRQP